MFVKVIREKLWKWHLGQFNKFKGWYQSSKFCDQNNRWTINIKNLKERVYVKFHKL